MYRQPSRKQRESLKRKLQAMRRGQERAALARGPRVAAPELPDLRRVVTITDHDSGQPVTHTIELHRTRRVDTYAVCVDGQPWRRAGWSAVLTMLRKAYPRVLSARCDCGQDAA
jgi:hypothetical protein